MKVLRYEKKIEYVPRVKPTLCYLITANTVERKIGNYGKYEIVLALRDARSKCKFYWMVTKKHKIKPYFGVLKWQWEKEARFLLKKRVAEVRHVDVDTVESPDHEPGPPYYRTLQDTVIVYRSNPRTIRKDHKFLQKAGILTLEADMSRPSRYALRFLIDKGIKSGVIFPTLEPFDAENRVYRICYFDIESASGWGKVGPHLDEPIVVIGYYDSYDDEYVQIYWNHGDVKWKSDTDKKLRVIKCENEKEVIETFIDYLNQKDPDLLVAWNLFGFDIQKLLHRMKYYRIPHSLLVPFAIRKISPSGCVGRTEGGRLKIAGRILFDLLEGYKQLTNRELERYDLEYVIEKEGLETEKIHIEKSFKETWKTNPEIILHRNYNDLVAMVQLEAKCGVIQFHEEIAKVAGLPLDKTLSRKNIIDTLLLRTFHGKYMFPTERAYLKLEVKSDDYKLPGAYVIKPEEEKVWDYVFVFDFKEMYPMIILAYNISVETLSVAGTKVVDENHKFWDPSVREGVIPLLVKMLREKRNEKKQLKLQAKTEDERIKYERQEKAWKYCTNACYGILDYEGFRLCRRIWMKDGYRNPVAEAVTLKGQELIKYIAGRCKEDGIKVIYGDTDSIFVVYDATDDNFLDVANQLQQKLANYLLEYERKNNLPEGHFKMELDKVYRKMWIRKGVKKRYVGELVYKDGKKTSQLDIVGAELIRSDSSVIEKQLVELIYRYKLFGENTIPEIKKILKQVRNKQVSILDVGIPSAIKKPLISIDTKDGKVKTFLGYGKPNKQENKIVGIPAHIKAALYSNMYFGTYFDAGSKFFRIPVKKEVLAKAGYPIVFRKKYFSRYHAEGDKVYKVKRGGGKVTRHALPAEFEVSEIAIDPYTYLPDEVLQAIDWEAIYEKLRKKVYTYIGKEMDGQCTLDKW